MKNLAGLKNIAKSAIDMASSRQRLDDERLGPNYATRLPDNLNANSLELQEHYHYKSEKGDFGIAPSTNPFAPTPYLGLRARLSQIWINKWTILLLLILVRVLLAVQGLDHDIANAKEQALSACSSVEKVGSAMASMPHYMSSGVNAMAAKSVELAVRALMGTLMLAVTAVEEIVLFVINLLTSTYVCLITLVVGGAMSAALDIIEKAGEFFSKALEEGTEELALLLKGFQDVVNKANQRAAELEQKATEVVEQGKDKVEEGLDKVADIFRRQEDPARNGAPITEGNFDLTPQIDKIRSIKLDSDALSKDLQELKDKIPTFDEVHNFTNNLIRTPFQFVKKQINESNIGFEFDKTVFPVAEKQALSFCSDNNGINDFFDGLSETATTARKAFLGIIIALAIIVCIPMAWREIRRWRMMQQNAKMFRDLSCDPLDNIYIGSRPFTANLGLRLTKKVTNPRKAIMIRWFVAYITSVPALFVLLLGIAGLLSCLFQYILLKQVEAETPALAAQVGAFTGTVVTALTNASEQWAVGANSVVKSTNDDINSNVFGWVNQTTGSVNDTLNYFVDGTQKVLNDTFGGTILYNPIQETLRCLVFLKIEGIQKAITWVKENANVQFPEFDKEVFSLGAAASLDDSGDSQTFLSSPGSEAADDITGAVMKLTNFMKEAIVQEIYVSLGLLGIYMIIVFIGLGRMLVGMFGREKTRAEGGPTFFTSDERQSPRPGSERFAGAETWNDAVETAHPDAAVAYAPFPPAASFPGDKVEGPLGLGMRKKEVPSERVRRIDGHVRQSSYGNVEKV